MTKGQIEYAIFRARRRFEDWNDVTGCFKRGASHYYEILAVLEDAVHCGAQEALGIYEPLEGEEEGASYEFGKECVPGISIPEELRKPRLSTNSIVGSVVEGQFPQETRTRPNGLKWEPVDDPDCM